MRKRLRIPIAVAFTFASTAPIIGAIASCDGGGGDDDELCSRTREPCTQDPHDTVNICPENTCIDSQGACPTGCIPAGNKRYCVPDGTDAGVCPQPSICIIAGEDCPAGCTPVG